MSAERSAQSSTVTKQPDSNTQSSDPNGAIPQNGSAPQNEVAPIPVVAHQPNVPQQQFKIPETLPPRKAWLSKYRRLSAPEGNLAEELNVPKQEDQRKGAKAVFKNAEQKQHASQEQQLSAAFLNNHQRNCKEDSTLLQFLSDPIEIAYTGAPNYWPYDMRVTKFREDVAMGKIDIAFTKNGINLTLDCNECSTVDSSDDRTVSETISLNCDMVFNGIHVRFLGCIQTKSLTGRANLVLKDGFVKISHKTQEISELRNSSTETTDLVGHAGIDNEKASSDSK